MGQISWGYTQSVGTWRVQAIGVVLISVLGGAPAVAVACTIFCNRIDRASASSAARVEPQHRPGQCSRQTAARDEPVSHVGGVDARNCCAISGQPRLSLIAARADASLLDAPAPAPSPSLPVSDRVKPRTLAWSLTGPPGTPPLPPALAVLRI